MCEFKHKFLSTREAAKALSVSESSIKRWVDAGKIKAIKTKGGHRKIEYSDLFQFVQARDQLASPLSSKPSPSVSSDGGKAGEFYSALESGNIIQMNEIISMQLIEFGNLESVVDRTIYPAFQELRSKCLHPSDQCRVLHRALDQIQKILAYCAPQKDLDQKSELILLMDVGYDIDGIPTLFAEYIASQQFKTLQLGYNPPLEVIIGSIEHEKPKYLWISANGDKTPGFTKKAAKINNLVSELGITTFKFGHLLEKKVYGQNVHEVSEFRAFSNLLKNLRIQTL